ncbi:hypothetical protein AAMO2058_000571800 [Amorphochlora amoebiformis]
MVDTKGKDDTPQRQTVALPVLEGADVTPEMLRNNLRANLFPGIVSGVQRNLKKTLLNNAVREVTTLESYQSDERDMKIRSVRPIEVENKRLWRLLHPRAQIIHAEQWTIHRGQGIKRDYRIHYMRHYTGDCFYVGVIPLSIGGAYAWTRNKIKTSIFG